MSQAITILRETRIDPLFPLSRHELLELCEVITDSLGLAGRPFVLKLVDDGEIARLNQAFVGCTGPTNILSFPADEDDGQDDGYLGELALSVNALTREVELYAQQPVAHLTRLLAHGLLHLVGHDHGDEMYDLTDRAVDRVLLEYADRI